MANVKMIAVKPHTYGGKTIEADEEYEVEEQYAATLVSLGRARRVDDEGKAESTKVGATSRTQAAAPAEETAPAETTEQPTTEPPAAEQPEQPSEQSGITPPPVTPPPATPGQESTDSPEGDNSTDGPATPTPAPRTTTRRR